MFEQTVTLTPDGDADTTYYSLDGDTPDTVYSAPFVVSSSSQIRTYSEGAGFVDSDEATSQVDIGEITSASGVFRYMEMPAQTEPFVLRFTCLLDPTGSYELIFGVADSEVPIFGWLGVSLHALGNLWEGYNGQISGYSFDESVSASADTLYHIEIYIDPSTEIYDFDIEPDGGSNLKVCDDYTFRFHQNNPLDTFIVRHQGVLGGGYFSNFEISEPIAPAPPGLITADVLNINP